MPYLMKSAGGKRRATLLQGEKGEAGLALRRALRRVHRLWKNRPKNPGRTFLHPLRRAIRRLRFTSELLAPEYGNSLSKLAKEAYQWQHLLGDYHDALIAQRLLAPLPTREAKALIKRFRAVEQKTQEAFWRRFRHGGWHELHRLTKKALP